MSFECGCERGGICTKTSICALNNAVEDATEELQAQIDAVKKRIEYKGYMTVEEFTALLESKDEA